jgi:hypothetical protein
MFGPSQTVVHLGSYFPIMILFASLAGLILRAAPVLCGVVSLGNLVLFLGNYWSLPIGSVGRLDSVALLIAFAALVLTGGLLWKIDRLPDCPQTVLPETAGT